MTTLGKTDQRIQQRMLRDHRVTSKEMDEAGAELPDSSENLRALDDEEIEKFAAAIPTEVELRAERIERALERAAAPPPKPPEPVQELDEDEI
jgi:hypothetical protein